MVYFTAILAVLGLFGIVTIPAIVSEGTDFMHRLQQENAWSVILKDVREGLGYVLRFSLQFTLAWLPAYACAHAWLTLCLLYLFITPYPLESRPSECTTCKAELEAVKQIFAPTVYVLPTICGWFA